MGQWEMIVRNGWFTRVASECYNKRFPKEVRAKLATWLEERENWILTIVRPEDAADQQMIFEFLHQMLEVYQRIPPNFPPVDPNSMDSFLFRHLAEEHHLQILNTLRANVQNLEFFNDIRKSLEDENELIRRLQQPHSITSSSGPVPHDVKVAPELIEKEQFLQQDQIITQKLENLKRMRLLKLEAYLKILDTKYTELYEPAEGEGCSTKSTPPPGNSVERERQIYGLSVNVRGVCPAVFHAYSEIKEIFENAVEELQDFNHEQRLVALGKTQVRDLDKIDIWWSGIADCLDSLAGSVQRLLFFCQNLCTELYPTLLALQQQIYELKDKQIKSSMVIEIQPKQVIRMNTFFRREVKLRVLRCSKNMNIHKVDQTLLYEEDAQRVLQGETKPPKEIAGEVNYKKTSPPITTWNSVLYKDMKVVEPQRKTKRGKQLVVEEKFYLHFQCKVKVDGKDYQLSAVSIRLSITSHPNQEGSAWGIILWENALETMRRRSSFPHEMNVKSPSSASSSASTEYDNVSWNSLIQSIDYKFQCLGRGITLSNKAYLKKKLFRGNIPPCEMVSWRLFAKDDFVEVPLKLLESNKTDNSNEDSKKKNQKEPPTTKVFTFWEWLWACIGLLQWRSEEHSLKLLWKEGKIEGFMEEAELRKTLKGAMNEGTFIIRFPEGRPESIGVYVYDANNVLQKFSYTSHDFDKIPLQKRIRNNDLLTHLYPNTNKKEAFPTYQRESEIINGYRRMTELREYFPKPKGGLKVLSIDQGAPSPASSHSFYSYRSQFGQSPFSAFSDRTASPSQLRGGQDQNNARSGPSTIDNCTSTTGNNMNLYEIMDFSASNEMSSSYSDNGISNYCGGINNWIDGVAASVLTSS